MSRVVLDASAILTLLNQEEGAERVAPFLADAVISTVNLAEVVTRLALAGMPETAIREALALLPLESVPFDVGQAIDVGLLAPTTKLSGLSLGDRACLVLAHRLDATAVTADQAWVGIDAGVAVELIR
ncbi:VapC toxin family PIN domain ribonuclease [Candidatus Methylomirabilis limnetica]|uniref:VapC toxin family PIN domain ribonuclease n=1 Tax=Candidatus Methylomirabilis limnetica TaxID=2033718 RepID=A0A2T4U0B2_9BACT|nr:type II toxin-antitoxin system VapC family toxin [Candidatus Methylomirabilis limnetica]PTL36791.1 VapC toxin family PIN domain ribonuclease [Candidatus Methylomirabilis limnetica]